MRRHSSTKSGCGCLVVLVGLCIWAFTRAPVPDHKTSEIETTEDRADRAGEAAAPADVSQPVPETPAEPADAEIIVGQLMDARKQAMATISRMISELRRQKRGDDFV